MVGSAVKRLILAAGGIEKWVKPGATILLKPNILLNAKPDTHITTHPEVVKAVAAVVKDAGGIVWIGDSPGIGTLKMASAESGILKAAREVGAEIKEFNEKSEVKAPGGYRISIAKAVLEADVVINLPKLKTHQQMYMTMGVKNCFGCIPGVEKAQWHYRAGIDEMKFAAILMDVYAIVRPALTLIDAVWGLEGEGPSSGGTPRHLGFLAVAEDAVALDRALIDILRLEPDKLKTLKAAENAGIGETNPENITVKGNPVPVINNFKTPARIHPLQFERFPGFLRKLAREFFTSKPVVHKKNCKKCGQCFQACPAEAIKWSNGEFPRFRYGACIRCFCCQEMCPHNSVKVRNGIGIRFILPFRRFLLKHLGI